MEIITHGVLRSPEQTIDLGIREAGWNGVPRQGMIDILHRAIDCDGYITMIIDVENDTIQLKLKNKTP